MDFSLMPDGAPARLTHLAQRSSKIKAAGGLVIPSDIAVRDRPFLNFRRFGDRLAQCGAGQAVRPFVRPDPDQVSVELDKDILRRAAPPGIIVIDLALERRHEPRNLFRLGGVGDIENADARLETWDPKHAG